MELDILNTNEPSPGDSTEIGSYFVANYPPFSQWSAEQVVEFHQVLAAPSSSEPPPLGLYLHIPFCRKRCKFCYFRVYTDKNSSDVDTYLQALAKEAEAAARAGREDAFKLSSDLADMLVDLLAEMAANNDHERGA